MPLGRRRTRFPAGADALARKLSRERIIPSLHTVQTPVWHVKTVMVRGSLPIAAISLPLLAIPDALPPRVLPVTVLLLTTAHGSVLVRQWIYRH